LINKLDLMRESGKVVIVTQITQMKTLTLPLYRVVKKHNRGLLKGIVSSEETTVKFTPGWICKRAIGGGGYEILSCDLIGTKSYPTS